jgi:hypothetical protein
MSDYFSSRDVEVIVTRTAPTEILKSARREMGDEIRGRKKWLLEIISESNYLLNKDFLQDIGEGP